MNIGGHDQTFWLTVIAAAILKIWASRGRSWKEAVFSGAIALFVAWVFTKPLISWMAWDAETYTIPVAVLLAWTSESIVRFIISLTPERALEIVKGFRK